MPTTREAIANPGASADQGTLLRYSAFSLTISPQSGVGGCTPSPRKPKPAVSSSAKLRRIEASTAITGSTFGSTSRNMMYSCGSPLRRALWTNSSGLIANVALRMTRLLLGMNDMPMMNMTIQEWSMPLKR